MNFFLDENFPKTAALLLESQGHAVYDIRGTDKEGLSDADIFEICRKQRAIFLTTDRDFFHTVHFIAKPHYGIIVIALPKPNAKHIIERLEWWLANFKDEDSSNICFLLYENRCQIFR